jgi:predicted transcriptional regulator
VQKDISTGVFFRLLNAEDRDWLSIRYALEAKLADDVPNVSAFLKSLQREGLLFREDNIHTCDHFVPFTLDPVESIKGGEDRSPSLSSEPITVEEAQFALLMTVLSHIRNQAVTEYTMIQYLRDLGYTTIMTDWENVCKLPYVNLSKNGNDRIVSISDEGRAYYSHIDTLVQQLPPPIALDSRAIYSTLNDLRDRVNKLPQDVIEKVNKPTQGVSRSLQSLLILERLLSSDYETVKSLADHNELKDGRMVQLRLRQLEQLGMVREQCFRVGLSNRHYYYYFEKKAPELTDILEPSAVNGLQILMKNNYIPEREIDDKVLQRIIGSHWLTALKISSILNEKKIITIEDLTSEDNIKIESHYNVLYSLQKIGAVNHYRIFREFQDHKVVYFFAHEYPNGLPLSDQIKFLKPYQQTIMNEFQRNKVIIPEFNTFNEWLGDHWPVVLRIYNILLTDENLPQSDGTKILHLYDLVQRMNDCSLGIREALNKLGEIGVLDRYSWFEKSYYFQLKETKPVFLTDNPLLPMNIKNPLKAIEEISNIHFQDLAHLREIMTRHWKNSLRIYTILSKIKTSYSTGISRDNLKKILKENNIVLKNLARYIKPLKDTEVLFTYRNKQQMCYQLRQ